MHILMIYTLSSGAKADGMGNLGADYTSYPIIIAVGNRNKVMVELLLKHGARKNVKGEEGLTPLALARRLGYTEIVRLLENKARKKKI